LCIPRGKETSFFVVEEVAAACRVSIMKGGMSSSRAPERNRIGLRMTGILVSLSQCSVHKKAKGPMYDMTKGISFFSDVKEFSMMRPLNCVLRPGSAKNEERGEEKKAHQTTDLVGVLGHNVNGHCPSNGLPKGHELVGVDFWVLHKEVQSSLGKTKTTKK